MEEGAHAPRQSHSPRAGRDDAISGAWRRVVVSGAGPRSHDDHVTRGNHGLPGVSGTLDAYDAGFEVAFVKYYDVRGLLVRRREPVRRGVSLERWSGEAWRPWPDV